jgi:ribonuclease BN (tRNA processing enzyme)
MTLLNDYFNVETLVHNDNKHASFTRCGVRFELVRDDHIYVEKKFDIPSYGLIMEKLDTGKKIFYTGDTKHDYETYQWIFKHVDTIFHDCQLFDQPAAVHATYNELKTLPDDIRAKIWLMHYGDNYEQFNPVQDGFRGFAKQRVEMDFDEI